MYQRWEEYGYLDYVTYNDYLNQLVQDGELDEETRSLVGGIGRTPDKDDPLVAEYVAKFTEHYESQGYEVIRHSVAIHQGVYQHHDNRYHRNDGQDAAQDSLY